RRAVRCLSPGSAHERVNHNPTRTPTRPKVDMRQDDSVDRLHRIDSEVETVDRSEEHTSELQSLTNLVCRLLLEKKKKNNKRAIIVPQVRANMINAQRYQCHDGRLRDRTSSTSLRIRGVYQLRRGQRSYAAIHCS